MISTAFQADRFTRNRLWVVVCAMVVVGATERTNTAFAEPNPFLPPDGVDTGWPFVRGPNYDGHSLEINLADEWPADGPPVLWHRDLGQGYSAFVAQGRRVYTQAQSLGGQYVCCLDADTGKTLWRYRYAAPYELIGVYPGPRATPTLSDGFVYFAAPDGLIGCLKADTGEFVWSRNVVDEFDAEGGVGFGYACSPTLIDGLAILPVGGAGASLVALDARTGETVWSSGDDPASYTPAYPILAGERKLVVGYLKNALVVCDRLTGERLLREELSYGYDEHAAWPIYSEPNLWLSGPFRGGSRLLKLSPKIGRKAETVWASQMLSNDVMSSVLVDGFVYGFDIFDVQSKVHRPSRGKFRCLEFLNGEERWSQGSGRPWRRADSSKAPEIGQAGLIAADGKLILLNETGQLILLRATPERCEELARTNVLTGELTWTPPALHRGRVYLRNHSRAVCVYVGEPALLALREPTLRVTDVPQSTYRDLATTILAIEPEYAFDIPTPAWLWRWWLTSLAILVAADLVGWLIARRRSPTTRRRISRLAGFLAGAAGTTLLSGWIGEFFFTWPVCLFIAFEVAATRERVSTVRETSLSRSLRARLPLCFWLTVCVVYFLLCRRLSLIFEWAFLAGFVGALPFCRLKMSDPPRWRESLLRLASFTTFYAVGAALLAWKY